MAHPHGWYGHGVPRVPTDKPTGKPISIQRNNQPMTGAAKVGGGGGGDGDSNSSGDDSKNAGSGGGENNDSIIAAAAAVAAGATMIGGPLDEFPTNFQHFFLSPRNYKKKS